jgi:hypothetical protein
MLLRSFCVFLLATGLLAAAVTPPKKPHVVTLGAVRKVPYSRAGDPAGAAPDETSLKTRALLVDGRVSEWTTGDAHDITDRSFVVRRALRINDSLPSDAAASAKPTAEHWVWQRGPWLLVDRVSGRVTALKLPDYDPGVSQVAWFRDYAAYCGVTPSGKSLYAVVSQLGVRKPALSKKLSAYKLAESQSPACGLPEWQREPLRITFHPAGKDAASFDLAAGSAALVESGDEDADAPAKP